MAITVNLWVNNSDPKCAYKNLTDQVSITGTFRMKEPMDILNPVFEISKSTAEYENVKWQNYNYCIIPNFGGRHYFMTIRTLSNGILECICHVDVLSTYIADLAGKKFVLARYQNASVGNLYADDRQPLYANKVVEGYYIGSLDESTAANAKHYVLTVAGGGANA